MLTRHICTFVCLEATTDFVCGNPARGENCAEHVQKSLADPNQLQESCATRPLARARREEVPQKHPDVVRRPVGGGALLALPARTGAKCKHDAADELRRRPVDWPLALSFDPSGPASDDAHSQREYSDACVCVLLCVSVSSPGALQAVGDCAHHSSAKRTAREPGSRRTWHGAQPQRPAALLLYCRA